MNSFMDSLIKLKQTIRVNSSFKSKSDSSVSAATRFIHLVQQLPQPFRDSDGIGVLEMIYDILLEGKLVFKKNEGNQIRECLLVLWRHLLSMLNQSNVNNDMKKLGRYAILSLIDRENFSLPWLKKHQITPEEDFVSAKERLKHTETMEIYREVLISTLNYSSDLIYSLQNAPFTFKEDELHFCAKVFAVIYTRVPYVSNYIYNHIKAAQSKRKWLHPRKTKWRMNIKRREDDNVKTQDENEKREHSSHSSILELQFLSKVDKDRQNIMSNWKQYNPYLPGTDDKELLPKNEYWIEKLSSDGEFFYVFSRILMNQLNTTLANGWAWTSRFHYELITNISFDILKECCYRLWKEEEILDIDSCPCTKFCLTATGIRNVLKNSEILLSENASMINHLILVLYEATNAYHLRSVECCLLQLERWLKACTRSFSISPFVDQVRFLEGLRILFFSEHFEILKKVLLFFFRQLDFYEGQFRQLIVDMFVESHFRLFLHWSKEVRSYYHHILIYKIVRANRLLLSSKSDKMLVANRNKTDRNLIDGSFNTFGLIDQTNWSKFDALILYLIALTSPSATGIETISNFSSTAWKEFCPEHLEKYANVSLDSYSDVLHAYYYLANSTHISQIVMAPPLGFC